MDLAHQAQVTLVRAIAAPPGMMSLSLHKMALVQAVPVMRAQAIAAVPPGAVMFQRVAVPVPAGVIMQGLAIAA